MKAQRTSRHDISESHLLVFFSFLEETREQEDSGLYEPWLDTLGQQTASDKQAMAEFSDPHLVIEALRILTRADQGGLSLHTGSDKCRFDQLLISNAETLREILDTDPHFSVLQSQWKDDTTVTVPSRCSSRWDFVLYCLKTLHLLQESLKSSVAEYTKQKPESVRPSRAPQISPDTLSFEEQKVVLTAVQFVVCLGISPNLDKGVGIPIEIRSEFSKLIQASSVTGEVDSQEKQQRLFTCLKVFIFCIFTPSLGSVILSRHLTDILAGLLQLTHSINKEMPKKSNKNVEKLKDNENSPEVEKKEPSNDTLGATKKGVSDGNILKLDADLPAANQLTPASIVDHVRKSFQDESDISRASQQCTAETDDEYSDEPKTAMGKKETSPTKCNERGANKTGDATNVSMKLEEIDVDYCEKVLEDLMEKIYPPLLVKTLLLLQGGPRPKKQPGGKVSLPPAPAWLRKVCGKQLTAIMMRPKGVQSVLRGMLDSPGEGQGMSQASDWRKCDAVAKLIACCPLKSLSVESYYKTIGPQILEILHIPDKQVARQFLRVACSTITSMAGQYPDLTRQYVILPLIEPLVRCTENNETLSCMNQSKVVVEEGQLSPCVEDCHRVFVSGNTATPQLIQSLQPVVLTLFQLLLFTKQGVSALKTACHELIIAYLKQMELTMTLTCLELMAFQRTSRPEQGFVRMHPNVLFSHGSSGGVVAVYNTEGDRTPASQDVCVQCMVDLLKDLQNDGTAGEFLIYMLQELTTILRAEVEGRTVSSPGKPDCADGEVLLRLETEYQSQEEQFYRKLLLLDLLATVCESLGPSCIKSTRNTLEFVRATLERAVEVCKATTDPVFEVFESETLTMAMGLLTAVLTGAMQVTGEDRKTMEELLPLLQDVCDNHPESSVQEMASDLRIAIATHGAVWSEVTRSNAGDFKDLKTKIQQNTNKEKKPVKKPPVIEVISDSRSKDIKHNIHNSVSDRKVDSKTEQDKLHTERKQKEPESKAGYGNKEEMNTNKTVHSVTDSEAEIDKTKQKLVKGSKCLDSDETKLHKPETEMVQDGEHFVSKTKPSAEGPPSRLQASQSELEEAFKELCDPLLPVRGHGLIRLTRMVQRRDKEAYDRKETVLKIFEENLDHPDSYMYLSSVNGLAAMADVFPDFVIPRLCEQFANAGKEGKKRSPELRMKLGEIMVKASRSLGDTIPKYRDLLMNTVLTGARDVDAMVRASSMSNLGEICKLLHFSLGNIVQEVFVCCKSLLKSDSDPEVRKGAAVALTLLLQGLGQDIHKVLDTVLLDLYRLLKLVMTTEKDEKVKLNANLALNELEDIMKGVIFPQQKLEKRIRVLDME